MQIIQNTDTSRLGPMPYQHTSEDKSITKREFNELMEQAFEYPRQRAAVYQDLLKGKHITLNEHIIIYLKK